MVTLGEFKAKYSLNEQKIDYFLELLANSETDLLRQQAGYFSWEDAYTQEELDNFEYSSGSLQDEQAYYALQLLRSLNE